MFLKLPFVVSSRDLFITIQYAVFRKSFRTFLRIAMNFAYIYLYICMFIYTYIHIYISLYYSSNTCNLENIVDIGVLGNIILLC